MSRLRDLALCSVLLAVACSEQDAGGTSTADGASSVERDADVSAIGSELDASSEMSDGASSNLDSGGSEDAGAAQGDAAQDGASSERFPALRITSDTASIEFTPVLVAAQDFYPGEAAVSSGGIPELLRNAQVDLGTNATTQTLRQSVNYPEVRIIFTVTETFYRIVANRAAGISKLADLAGKRVGTIPNTSSAFYLDKMLRTVGLTEADVTIVNGGLCIAEPCRASSLPALLTRGAVDAVTLWEPSPQLAQDALQDNAIQFQDRAVYREIVNLHTTTDKLADPTKRRAIVQFVRSLAESQALYRARPEQVWPRISAAIGIDAGVLAKVWQYEQFSGTLASDLVEVLEEEERWLARNEGRAPRPRSELATFIDDSVAREALQQ
jgi:sulfonate transport system substrate-binding protein